jgi:hypothetical protein
MEFHERLDNYDPKDGANAMQAWAKKEGISEDALFHFAEVVIESMGEIAESPGITAENLFTSIVLSSFTVGWEAGVQYGGRDGRKARKLA